MAPQDEPGEELPDDPFYERLRGIYGDDLPEELVDLFDSEATLNALLMSESGEALWRGARALSPEQTTSALISAIIWQKRQQAEQSGDPEAFGRWLSGEPPGS